MVIRDFTGDFEFLSNFYYDSDPRETVEHRYQAAKTLDLDEKKAILEAPTPGKAKRLGQKVTIRRDWDKIKVGVMRDLLREKFEDPSLRQLLLATYPNDLIEGNTWHDQFWGDCSCPKHEDIMGANWLGTILMELREEIRSCS